MEQEQSYARLGHVTDKLLMKMAETIDGEKELEARDLKALSSALKELGEVKEIFANPRTAAARRLVAPNGGSAAHDLSSFAPDDHVVRVTFNGSSAAKPLVASLAAEKGILVSVLSADTRDLSGQCYGSMLLKLPKDTEEAKQAAAYMRSQPGVTVEEVTGE